MGQEQSQVNQNDFGSINPDPIKPLLLELGLYLPIAQTMIKNLEQYIKYSTA